MPVNNPLHSRQAYSRSGEFAAVMETLKSTEKPAGVCRVETRAVVTNEVGERAFPIRFAELDTTRITF